MINNNYKRDLLRRKARAATYFSMSIGFIVTIYLIFFLVLRSAGLSGFGTYLYSLALLLITLLISGYEGVGLVMSYNELKDSFLSKETVGRHEVDEELFKSSNLTKSDMRYFYSTVTKLEEQIDEIIKAASSTPNLREILYSSERLNIINSILESMLSEPERMNELSDYRDVYIPSLLEIVKTYVKVDSHDIKDDKSLEALKNSEEVIIEICNNIKDTYVEFKRKDVLTLKSHVDYTRSKFERDKERKSMFE